MKIKVKDEMNDIRIKISHKELVILKEALYSYNILNDDIKDLNVQLFDRDEMRDSTDVERTVLKIYSKIQNKLLEINPF